MLEVVLNTPVFRLDLVMFCVIITNIWWGILNSYIARGSSVFLWILQKNCLDNISSKHWKKQRLSFVNKIQYPHPEEQHLPFKQTGTITIFSFRYQSCAWPPSSPFYWQNPCSLCKREIDLVVVLEYTFFQLCFNVEQISRYTRFRRNYVNRHCRSDQPLSKLYCFSAWFALFKAAKFLFCSCLSPMIVHLCKLFLLSTPVTECYELQGG